MRIVIAALAAAAVAGLAFSADAAPANKKKQRYAANKERVAAQRNAAPRDQEYGYDSTPEHYRTAAQNVAIRPPKKKHRYSAGKEKVPAEGQSARGQEPRNRL